MAVQTQIQARRGTAATWTSTNPTLAAGETGYETDTGRFKIGTGSTAWASLAYFNRDPLTTKGDLYTFSTTDDRLAVGANGETLVADSSTSTGLRYQSAYNGNVIINGAFDIAQRGTSVSVPVSTNTNALDRFQLSVGANGASTVSQQSVGDTTNLPTIRYCARVQRNSGQTGTTTMYFATSLETSDSIRFAGQTVTVSFYARAGANFSSSASALNVTLRSGTGTDQNVYGYTGGASPISAIKTLTTTWQRFTSTATVGATATELAVYFDFTPVGTAGVNDYFEVTGVQLELGSVATTFKRSNGAGGTIQGELAACQRYYVKFNNSAQSYASVVPTGYTDLSTSSTNYAVLPVEMRIAPTAVEYSSIQILDGQNGAFVPSAVSVNSAMTTNKTVVLGSTISGATAGRPSTIRGNNSTSAYVAFSAEL